MSISLVIDNQIITSVNWMNDIFAQGDTHHKESTSSSSSSSSLSFNSILDDAPEAYEEKPSKFKLHRFTKSEEEDFKSPNTHKIKGILIEMNIFNKGIGNTKNEKNIYNKEAQEIVDKLAKVNK